MDNLRAIIPPYIFQNVAKNGTPTQKKSARRSLMMAATMRQRRLAPLPGVHVEGENRDVHDAQNGTKLPGVDARDEDDPISQDEIVNEAFDAAGNTYKYFSDIHQRKSIDDRGMLIFTTVHYDKGYDNAYWDSSQIVVGDGDLFLPFTHDLTVLAHEISHGVTQFTANLEYQDQPGALNESVSDVFSALVEQYTYQQSADKASWLVGQLIFGPKLQGRALRDMLNPGTAYDDPVLGKDPQPAHMNNLYTGWEDNGGVHINSGIPNKAFATAALLCGGNAWETVGPVWYKVLTTMAKSNTDFQSWANMTYSAAPDGTIKDAIVAGWGKVGIAASGEQQPPDTEPGSSPCLPDVLAVLSDPVALELVRKLGKQPSVRRMIARARLL